MHCNFGVVLCVLVTEFASFSPDSSEEDKEWSEKQDYPDEDDTTEGETSDSDIAEDENSGTNMFNCI